MKLGHFVACERKIFCNLAQEHENIQVVTKLAELSKYQTYIVEQWITDRRRFSKSVVAYTADVSHTIKVCVLDFDPNHTMTYAKEVEQIFVQYQEDKVRSMETPLGTILVTDLRRFPPSLNLIHVPDGDFDAHYSNLVLNLNLRRFGCMGRASVSLQVPDAAKVKFIQIYKIHANVPFDFACREVVLLTQVILSMFGLLSRLFIDGLFCDHTIMALKRFRELVVDFKESLEDTLLSSELLSYMLVKYINLRNSLYFLGYHDVPKDPFTQISQMTKSICAFQESNNLVGSGQFDEFTLQLIESQANARANTPKGSHSLSQLPKSYRWRFDSYICHTFPSASPLHIFSSSQMNSSNVANSENTNAVVVELALVGQHCHIDRVRYLMTGKRKSRSVSGDYADIRNRLEVESDSTTESSHVDMKNISHSRPVNFLRGVGEGFVGTLSAPVKGVLRKQYASNSSVASSVETTSTKPFISRKEKEDKKKSTKNKKAEKKLNPEVDSGYVPSSLKDPLQHQRMLDSVNTSEFARRQDLESAWAELRRGSVQKPATSGNESTVSKLLFGDVVADRRANKEDKLVDMGKREAVLHGKEGEESESYRDWMSHHPEFQKDPSDHQSSERSLDMMDKSDIRGSTQSQLSKKEDEIGDGDELENEHGLNIETLESLIVDHHLLSPAIMVELKKREKTLESLREILDGQVKEMTEIIERLELLYERQMNAYRDYEVLIQSMLEDIHETDELVKVLDDQANKLKYNLHTSDEKLKETTEVIDNLKTKLSNIERDIGRRKDARSVRMIARSVSVKTLTTLESTRQILGDFISTVYDNLRVYLHTHFPYHEENSIRVEK